MVLITWFQKVLDSDLIIDKFKIHFFSHLSKRISKLEAFPCGSNACKGSSMLMGCLDGRDEYPLDFRMRILWIVCLFLLGYNP